MSTKKKEEKEVEAYGNKWRRVKPALPDEIASIETNLKVSMPENLKHLLQTCAGGYPSKNFYENYDNDIEVSIGYILPTGEDKKRGNLLTVYKQLCDTFDFPDELIPFAQDSGHANQFCFNIKNSEIFYWLHDDPSDRMRKVSDSLEEFLNGLTESPF